ncbi:L-serine ammonia-lyase, iron-sulfur-dependent subunit beta [Eubacterium sp.]|uniref:L-serine ammonia-lyase, iron-sulfur-dependent subunit beta n=1 Tax=Eubacterium sp. TaxID=142586 RepID=UPI0025E066E6|nr:L-serine ammonia-lyase, iron-sulfur-dependent subunit beta [Eubacterium sp.]MDY3812481.1 L-serine ammonia-lyase, iron-sulfur-dependent subunit beta [Eubacterium sp.]MDY5242397.1 L-serine ammonia-lyase, iron-sulfur-dependent subunit beta [Eubacterium sp.]
MNIFEILGPVMVGPSSSHTAGAVRIGYVCRKLMGEKIVTADIELYGSFLLTGKGHGTPQAIVAGLLGMTPDDARIPDSFEIAKAQGLKFTIGEAKLKEAHPNSVLLKLTGESGKELEVIGESLGGSIINIAQIDGLPANISGDYPTLIASNMDVPGMVAKVSKVLFEAKINIAQMHLYRASRGKNSVLIAECDQEIEDKTLNDIRDLDGIMKVSYLGK